MGGSREEPPIHFGAGPHEINFPIIFAFNQEDAAANAGQSLTATQTFA